MSEIRVFPNSGHHYEFVPLGDDRCKDPKFSEVVNACRRDDQPWESHPKHPWIRFRKGVKEENGLDVVGYWVAVESNLGPPERGFVYEPEMPVTPRPVEVDGVSTPYAFSGLAELPAAPWIDLTIPVCDNERNCIEELPLPRLVWIRSAGDDPIDVDLVVDFGNTRTVALLIENRAGPFQDVCQPVRFIRRGTAYEAFAPQLEQGDPCAIVDSWLVLHEPVFSQFWPPERVDPVVVPRIESVRIREGFWKSKSVKQITAQTTYLPQTFVEISPAIIGGGNGKDGAREILNNAVLDLDANFFLSSPKRYAWDSDPMGQGGEEVWHVVLNRWSPRQQQTPLVELPLLNGPVLMFMDPDGRFWDIDEPPNERSALRARPHPNERPNHPRCDALTWAALSILEAAYRQIMWQQYRQMMGLQFLPRRLHSVRVTFPSGWTSEELARYRQQWQKAINIFTLAHFENRGLTTATVPEQSGDRPELFFDLDEAVASQLPIIFSEVEALGRRGENWVELVGRGVGVNSCVRVMNIDIGGGSTDVAMVEYRDTLAGGVNMEAKLLFRNTSATAGDEMVKRIIERVLLPAVQDELSDGQERHQFARLFRRSVPAEWKRMVPAYRQKLSRIVRLVLIPIVNHWLRGLSSGQAGSPTEWSTPLKLIQDGMGQQLVQESAVRQFNDLVQKLVLPSGGAALPWDKAIPCNGEKLQKCIVEVFEPLFEVFGCLAAAFDCDLVLVSGKPSELPEIRDLLERSLPILPQRILFARDYPVGDWYPFGATDGKIDDAKTPTAVGAALAQAMRGIYRFPDWKLEMQTQLMLNDNYWGLITGGHGAQFSQDLLLRPEEEECSQKMLVGKLIGRMRYLAPQLSPEPVYKLRWKDRKRSETPLVHVKLRRVKAEDASEQLQLVEVIAGCDEQGREITLNDLELKLCTLSDDVFWMDNPCFEIES